MSTLSTIATQEYYAELGNSLPPPVVHTRETHERRLITAIEAFNALRPGDAYEARLAVQIVAYGAHGVDSLRLAGRHRDDFAKMARCRAQAASMARAESAAKRTLEREQKLRLAVEAVAGAAPAQRAAEVAPAPSAPVEQVAVPPRTAVTPAAPAPVAAASAPPPVRAESATPPVPAGPAPPPSPEAIAEAEAFTEVSIEAAAQIRRDRGVTPQSKALFHRLTLPTDPAVVDALVRGTTELLTLLDEVGGGMLEAAD